MSLQNGNDNDIQAVFRSHRVHAEPHLRKIESLFNARQRRRIKHDPEYQRNYVWDKHKASFFIESILFGTEIPPLIVFKRPDGSVEVIDGRQRFETIQRFVQNEFDLSHRGLLSMKRLSGKKFENLERPLIESFWDTSLRVFEFSISGVSEVNSAQEDLVKKEIFRRYNSGITSLRKSEFEKARHINDPVTQYFGDKLKYDHRAFTAIVRLFFSQRKQIRLDLFDPSLLDEIMLSVRRLIVLDQVPVRFYEREMGRQAASILYEKLSKSQDPAEVYSGFMSRVNVLERLRPKLSTLTISRKRYLYETLYWSLAVLEKEGINTCRVLEDEAATRLTNWIKDNPSIYDSDRAYFSQVAIERREKTAQFFEEYFNVNLDEYIHNKGKLSRSDLRNVDYVGDCEEATLPRLNRPDPQSITVEDLNNLMLRKRFLVRPKYQRYERISVPKKSAIIESMFLGIKLPPIFVFERNDGVSEVVDGQQRILSILGYMRLKYMDENEQLTQSKNEGFRLSGLNILTELNGKTFSELDSYLQDKLWEFTLYQVIIRQKDNPQFDPVDLFVRLNNKPYAIKENTFEMWNSHIDRATIQKIKKKTLAHNGWFYLRKDNKRMDNENLFTTLAYLGHKDCSQNGVDGVLEFYARGGKISSRIKSKNDITKLLELVGRDSGTRREFDKALKSVESFVRKTRTLLIDGDLDGDVDTWLGKQLTALFASRARSLNQFYVLWYALRRINLSMIKTRRTDIKRRIHRLIMFVRDTEGVDEEQAVTSFYEQVSQLEADHRQSSRRLRLSNDEISEFIISQNHKCPLCNSALYVGEDVEVDHIIPLSLGGSDSLENIQIVHWICNRAKGNKLA